MLAEVCGNVEGMIWTRKTAVLQKASSGFQHCLCYKSPAVFPWVYLVYLRQLTIVLLLLGYASVVSPLVSQFGAWGGLQ